MFIFNRQLFEADPPSGGANPNPPGGANPPAHPDPQKPGPSVDELTNSLNAARRREDDAKKLSADLQKRLDAFEEEKRKKEEAELTELDKLKKQIADKEMSLGELNKFKEKWEQYEASTKAQVDKEMESLTDEQKDLVSALPLEKRMSLINQYKEASSKIKPGGAINPGKLGDSDPLLVRLQSAKSIAERNAIWEEFNRTKQ